MSNMGPVTRCYPEDRDVIIGHLKRPLATEWVCVLRYLRHAYHISGVVSEPIKAHFLQHADGSLRDAGNKACAPPLSLVKVILRKANRRIIMGSVGDRISGAANSAVGKAKEAVGKETGDAKLAAKGAAQDAKGKMKTAVGKGKAALGK